MKENLFSVIRSKEEIIKRYTEMLDVERRRHEVSHRAMMRLCDALLAGRTTQPIIDAVGDALKWYRDESEKIK